MLHKMFSTMNIINHMIGVNSIPRGVDQFCAVGCEPIAVGRRQREKKLNRRQPSCTRPTRTYTLPYLAGRPHVILEILPLSLPRQIPHVNPCDARHDRNRRSRDTTLRCLHSHGHHARDPVHRDGDHAVLHVLSRGLLHVSHLKRQKRERWPRSRREKLAQKQRSTRPNVLSS